MSFTASGIQVGGAAPHQLLAGDGVSINSAGKTLDDGGSNLVTNANTNSSRKSPLPQPNFNAGLYFKEKQLKQLRAQCLVYLAFRNGLTPKELHLNIALENMYSKEEREGKEQLLHNSSSVSEVQVLVDNLKM